VKLERILRGTAGTISATFTQDGVPDDPTPDSASVTLTRASTGAELGPYDAYDGGEGVFQHTLTPTEASLLETFTASWTVTFGDYEQTLKTTVEVVGGFLFSLQDLRAMKLGGASDTVGSRFATAQMTAMRTLVEQSLEDVCGVAFVPRFSQETLSGSGCATVMLKRPMVSAIRAASLGGTTLTPSANTVSPSGILYNGGRSWSAGFENVVVGYEHGHGQTPARVSHAALLLAKRWLVEGPADDRATSITVEGTGTFAMVTPGMRGAMFDLPEVNAVVQQYDMSVLVA
jgi:hypothetical protein